MANEISVSGSISISKNGESVSDSAAFSSTLAGSGKFTNVQSIGFAAAELLVFPVDLVTEGVGLVWLKNLDTTNFVTISQKTGANTNPVSKLLPGEFFPVRNPLAPTNDPGLWAQADTAAVPLQIVAGGT